MSDSIGSLGILVQNGAYAVIIPLYLVIYLSTSPLIGSNQVSDYLLSTADIAAIPVSMALGYALPTVLMCLPAPSVINHEQKQTFIAIWQMFPLWVAILQRFIPYLTAIFTKNDTPSSVRSHKNELSSLRQLYFSLLVVAGIGQISTVTLMAISRWFSDLFAPDFVGVFDPSHVFLPSALSPSTKMPSIGAGALLLLQYDEFIGSASMALFATTLYVNTSCNSKMYSISASLVMRGIAALVLTGPLGYAVACIWARDELIVAEYLGKTQEIESSRATKGISEFG